MNKKQSLIFILVSIILITFLSILVYKFSKLSQVSHVSDSLNWNENQLINNADEIKINNKDSDKINSNIKSNLLINKIFIRLKKEINTNNIVIEFPSNDIVSSFAIFKIDEFIKTKKNEYKEINPKLVASSNYIGKYRHFTLDNYVKFKNILIVFSSSHMSIPNHQFLKQYKMPRETNTTIEKLGFFDLKNKNNKKINNIKAYIDLEKNKDITLETILKEKNYDKYDEFIIKSPFEINNSNLKIKKDVLNAILKIKKTKKEAKIILSLDNLNINNKKINFSNYILNNLKINEFLNILKENNIYGVNFKYDNKTDINSDYSLIKKIPNNYFIMATLNFKKIQFQNSFPYNTQKRVFINLIMTDKEYSHSNYNDFLNTYSLLKKAVDIYKNSNKLGFIFSTEAFYMNALLQGENNEDKAKNYKELINIEKDIYSGTDAVSEEPYKQNNYLKYLLAYNSYDIVKDKIFLIKDFGIQSVSIDNLDSDVEYSYKVFEKEKFSNKLMYAFQFDQFLSITRAINEHR